MDVVNTPEFQRLQQDNRREVFWKLWGTYLSERQWGTVREDYSADGDVWKSFPFDMARQRAYRWGEDGILGWTDYWCRLCFSLSFWNGKDPFLKDRLFGLSGPEGNHGEDVKEVYHLLENTPTHSHARAVYLYPQGEFPYAELRKFNAGRSRDEGEYELVDTGIFEDNKFFEVEVEYAKEDFDKILILVRIKNCGPDAAVLHFLPRLWFRNSWSWGDIHESAAGKPVLWLGAHHKVLTKHPSLPAMEWHCERAPKQFLFAENETNQEALYGQPNTTPYPKDAFHRCVVDGQANAVNPRNTGTQCAAWYQEELRGGEERVFRFRLDASNEESSSGFGHGFEKVVGQRRVESLEYHEAIVDPKLGQEERAVLRQSLSGLLWSKQFYSLVQDEWRDGDAAQPAPPPGHAESRNRDWENIFCRDIFLMPDTWEYPYFCAWDLAFHSVSVSRIDPFLARQQLDLLAQEWLMHPNGQYPAYEWNFSDVNPPVHSWAVWRLHRLPLSCGPDRAFLERQFHKLLLNFTWWVNRKDPGNRDLFSGGFLGLDNIGVFDRSKPLPTGGVLKQADGTAWMAFYCVQMLMISLELAQEDSVYETMAMKFFQHFIRITNAMNSAGGCGLWDEQDGFYYDLLEVDGRHEPLRVRSLVGLMPLLAVAMLPKAYIHKLPEFRRRMIWFMSHRSRLSHHITELNEPESESKYSLLALPTKAHLKRVLRVLFDESEFLSPFGIRSLSKFHEKNPFTYWANGVAYSVDYEPGESRSGMFGGNSNWRGPVWLPMNYLLIEALRVYHRFYGETFQVEFPTNSGDFMSLGEAARRVAERVASIFLPDANGHRPCIEKPLPGSCPPGERMLFHEYFHAETGRGCGASHQTGWTSLIGDLLNLESHWDF